MEKGKVDIELIRRYFRGELTPREMYALERRAQADPMLMDVILGMEEETLAAHDDNLADIRKRIAERTERRRTTVRRLVPAQRWAIAASLLAVLTVGMWWFIREDKVEQQREAAVAAIPEEVPETVPETEIEAEADAATPQLARSAPPVAAVAEKKEEKEERLAVVTPEADTGAGLQDSVVVVGFGTQRKSKITGAVARTAAAETEAPALNKAQAPASRTEGIRIRGTTVRKHAFLPPITGKVVDQETQKPMAGVALQTADGQRVTTDRFGRFTLANTSDTLTLNYIGYEQQTVDIAGRDTLTIALKHANVDLDEVVVVGYGTDKRQSLAVSASHPNKNQPQPEDGWLAYRQYLKNAVKLAPGKKGAVDLTLTVDDNGRPTDIKVVETTDVALNKFAVLIVRDGPCWVLGADGEREVTLRVEF